jgi:PAS domain-containing protein
MGHSNSHAALRLVHSAVNVEITPEVAPGWFCGHCAAGLPPGLAPSPFSRVCSRCGLGLLLETRADGLPAPTDAFLIVDRALRVQAASIGAERLLGAREEDLLDTPVGELLIGADAERADRGALAEAILEAASSADAFAFARVRPANTFGVRMRARVSACGPPRAALVLLEAPPRHLHSV